MKLRERLTIIIAVSVAACSIDVKPESNADEKSSLEQIYLQPLPVSLENIRYDSQSFQDTYEYVSFQGETEVVNGIILKRFGSVPISRDTSILNIVTIRGNHISWWLKSPPENFRTLRYVDSDVKVVDEIVISDGAIDSVVWHFRGQDNNN